MSGNTKYRDRGWLREQYVENELIAAEIAEKCGCSERTIQRWLDKHDIETRAGGTLSERKITDDRLPDSEWLRERYIAEGKSSREISDEIGVSKTTVLYWLDKHGIDTTKHKKQPVEALRDEEWLHEQYVVKNKSGHEIAAEIGCSPNTIYEWVREHGFQIQYNGKVSGSDHWWYSGGSFPYGDGWTKNKKRAVRRRDSFTCQDAGCSVTQAEHKETYGEKLHVHHLRKARDVADAEKRNSKENLITLCRDCHKRWEKISDAGLVPQMVTND